VPTFQVAEVGVDSNLNRSDDTKLADLNMTVPIPTSPRLDELAAINPPPDADTTEDGEHREMPTVTNLSPDSEVPLNESMRGTVVQSDLVKINEHPGQEDEDAASHASQGSQQARAHLESAEG